MKQFSKEEFARLMDYPREWLDWDMLADEVFSGQVSEYTPGSERASEHYRNGAFHWWLKKKIPTKEQLKKLVELTFLDPDPLMGEDVRTHIAKSKNCDDEIRALLSRSSL